MNDRLTINAPYITATTVSINRREICSKEDWDMVLISLAELRYENELLRATLEYISFASNACPVVIDGEDVPEKWQNEILKNLRHLGEHAEQALKLHKDSEHG